MRRFSLLLTLTLCGGCGAPAPVAIPVAAALPKLPPGTHQQTAEVPGVGKLNYTIEIPEQYDDKFAAPLVLALHYGYDGAKPDPYTGGEMIESFRAGLSGLNAIIIAPDALGGGWTTAQNEKAAVWLTTSVMQTYAVDGKKVIITGFSLGGEGTWFIGSRHQDIFTGAIPVAAPAAGGDVAWKVPVYVIHSDKDQMVSYHAAKNHAEHVRGKGTKLEFKTVNGLDHFDTNAYGAHLGDAVKWLQSEWK